MTTYFNLIYIVPNRFSKEKICVGVLANIDGIPYLGISDKKLKFALRLIDEDIRPFIRKSFRLLDFDVNKLRRGEDSLSLFDQPYSKKILKELTLKKKGLVEYSDLFELKRASPELFGQLFKKFTGEIWEEKVKSNVQPSFRKTFREFINHEKFNDFEKNVKLEPGIYPFIYKEIVVDLLRKTTAVTVFYPLDLNRSISTIQTTISRFRMIVQSLQQFAEENKLGKGRYYLVYDSTSQQEKRNLVQLIKKEKSNSFELIRISEMKDKI